MKRRNVDLNSFDEAELALFGLSIYRGLELMNDTSLIHTFQQTSCVFQTIYIDDTFIFTPFIS